MELIAAQYRGRARVLQAKLFVLKALYELHSDALFFLPLQMLEQIVK